MKARLENPSLRAVALHEAAHAVIAEAFGGRVLRLRLVRERPKRLTGNTSLGACRYDGRVKPYGRLATALVYAAGPAADQLWAGAELDRWSVAALRAAKTVGFWGYDFAEIGDIARVHVKLRQKQVFAVARELLKRDLTGDEVRSIMKRSAPKSWSRGRGC